MRSSTLCMRLKHTRIATYGFCFLTAINFINFSLPAKKGACALMRTDTYSDFVHTILYVIRQLWFGIKCRATVFTFIELLFTIWTFVVSHTERHAITILLFRKCSYYILCSRPLAVIIARIMMAALSYFLCFLFSGI